MDANWFDGVRRDGAARWMQRSEEGQRWQFQESYRCLPCEEADVHQRADERHTTGWAGEGASPFPAYVAMPTAPAGQSNFEDRTRSFDALVKSGLASTSTGTIESDSSWGGSKTKLAVKIYNLTEQGQKAFVKSPDGNPYGNDFCYGTPAVSEVTQFTEPSAAFGATMSSVAYTYHVNDQAGWATNPAMVEAFPILKQATGDKLEGKTTVVLTNNGWVDSRGSKF
ncbi:hypothetical protein QP150_19185 [Sphingomonas sp. 22L2VL55-3]